METLYDLLVVTHLLGMAALVGGYAVTATTGGAPTPNRVMLWGARLQVLTGLLLVGVAEAALDGELNHVKIGVKLLVALAVAALVEVAAARSRRPGAVAPGLVHAAGALGVVNVLVAALW